MATQTANSPDLEQAYANTCYRVLLGKRHIDVRIGQPCPELAGLYLAGETTAAIITAFNPRSRVLHNAENAHRHQLLINELRGTGLRCLDTVHLDDNGEWLPEHGVMVLGIDADAALRWAARYQQNAIVFLPDGSCPQLLWTTAQLPNRSQR